MKRKVEFEEAIKSIGIKHIAIFKPLILMESDSMLSSAIDTYVPLIPTI